MVALALCQRYEYFIIQNYKKLFNWPTFVPSKKYAFYQSLDCGEIEMKNSSSYLHYLIKLRTK